MNKLSLKIKNILTNWILSDILKAPLLDEVFKNETPEKKEEYAIEANRIKDSEFYNEFLKLMEQTAVSKIAREASDSVQMLFGKALLFYVTHQKTKLKEFASYQRPKEGEQTKW